jgi:hypothetical protein
MIFYRLETENLDLLGLEILHLGEDDNYLPSTAPQSAHSPKRSRAKASLYDSQSRIDDADDEDDEDFDAPLPKKQRRVPRKSSNIEVHDTALLELNGRTASKTMRKENGLVEVGKNHGKEKQKPARRKKRRIPENELVTVSQRPYDSDLEIDSRKRPHHMFNEG